MNSVPWEGGAGEPRPFYGRLSSLLQSLCKGAVGTEMVSPTPAVASLSSGYSPATVLLPGSSPRYTTSPLALV